MEVATTEKYGAKEANLVILEDSPLIEYIRGCCFVTSNGRISNCRCGAQ